MEQGYFSLVLHAHLPFVRHPEYDFFLEEDWLFEAITETYIPLIHVFEGLENDSIPYKVTLSLTPPLLAMLSDDLLNKRYLRYIKSLIQLSEEEIKRTRFMPDFCKVAKLYNERFRKALFTYQEKYKGDLIQAFASFQKKGSLEIITCAATHGYLPLLSISSETVKAQLSVAYEDYQRYFQRPPRGIWLPECGFIPGFDEILAKLGFKFFFLDAHGVIFGEPRPTFGNYAPVKCPSGVHAFARDLETSKVVWSKEDGYPGDVYYREFYRDIGHELDMEYLSPYLPEGIRKNTGIKYYRITDRRSPTKMVYDPDIAKKKIEAHAIHFLSTRISQVIGLYREIHKKPIIVSTYDAELFGHWWFEGPEWIDVLFRKMAKQNTIIPITPLEYLKRFPINQTVTPCQSSWGEKGYHEFWLNSSNDWIYKHLHEASFRMTELARAFIQPDSLTKKALNQAARELLLAQASDWAFILRTGTTVEYAQKKIKDHIGRFSRLYKDIKNQTINSNWLNQVEYVDNIFPDVRFEVFR